MVPWSPETVHSSDPRPAPGRDRRVGRLQQFLRHSLIVAMGVSLCFLATGLLLPYLKERSIAYMLPTTEHSLRQMGFIFKMYARESKSGRYPNLVSNSRIWAPDLSQLYPEYFQDPDIWVAREHPDAEHLRQSLRAVLEGPNPDYDTASGLMALSFAYLGHAANNEHGLMALLEARKAGLLKASGENTLFSEQGVYAYPLREGVERFLITDINGPAGLARRLIPSIPVVIEIGTWKYKTSVSEFKGCHVLYFDGHVAWVPLGKFPVLPEVMNRLSGLSP